MAGRWTEVKATVGSGSEVTAVGTVAVEIDEPAATRALASPLSEVGADHAFKVGAAECAQPDPS
jgi:hypothetical protein